MMVEGGDADFAEPIARSQATEYKEKYAVIAEGSPSAPHLGSATLMHCLLQDAGFKPQKMKTCLTGNPREVRVFPGGDMLEIEEWDRLVSADLYLKYL